MTNLPAVELDSHAPLIAAELSVQKHQDAMRRQGTLFGYTMQRGDILPAWGTRQRELALRNLYHHDYNNMFRGAIAGLIKRVQSTPWEVKAPSEDGDRWQQLLMQADFGDWDRFISKLVLNYSRHDCGAFIELIAPGDPNYAPTGAVVGIAVLDTLRTYPTGDPLYPAVYYDLKGKLHRLHRGRVIQFVDTIDTEESLPGYGDCALSRCAAPVWREILMGRYVEQFLDDNPPPGIRVFQGLTETEVQIAIDKKDEAAATDHRGEWGKSINLFAYSSAEAPDVKVIAHQTAPEQFDFEKYTALDARQIALGIGLDIQDIWELSGQGLGTATQSEVLAQKSRGKAFGRILKGLERVINQILPNDAEFQWKYRDPQDDIERANLAANWVGAVDAAIAGETITTAEGREILVNKIEAFHDALVDETGELTRLPDDDPKAGEVVATDTSGGLAAEPRQEETRAPAFEARALLTGKASKAFADTARSFSREFIPLVRRVQVGQLRKAVLRASLRDLLMRTGERAYDDGLREGEVDPGTLDAEAKADKRRAVAEWMTAQNPFVTEFINKWYGTAEKSDMNPALRANSWVSKSLRAIRWKGLLAAAGNQFFRWVWNPLKEHCKTCRRLNGQVHLLITYIKKGLWPGSTSLDCHGDSCGCEFQKARGPARGILPRTKPVLAGLRDRFVMAMRRA